MSYTPDSSRQDMNAHGLEVLTDLRNRASEKWHIEQLIIDLKSITKNKYAENTWSGVLCGLLCKYKQPDIAKQLQIGSDSIRGICSEIYRNVEILIGAPKKSVKGNNLISQLQNAGYLKEIEIQRIPHYLPPRTYTKFIGREEEIKKLMTRLSPRDANHITTVSGIGGVGKTALVLECAYRCLEGRCGQLANQPQFEAIIFTSAKQEHLDADGIRPIDDAEHNLNEIFRKIGNILKDLTIIQAAEKDKRDRAFQILCNQRTLLIVDNIDTIQDLDSVMSFLESLPECVKIVVTSRTRASSSCIHLQCLPEKDGLTLIEQQCQEKDISLNEEERKSLYKNTGGIPLTIVYAVGRISNGYDIDSILELLVRATGDPSLFIFQKSVREMNGNSSHKLLMTLSIFPQPPGKITLIEVAGISSSADDINESLAELHRISFATRNQKSNRFEMLSPTREYALSELANLPDFEREVRKRWVKWYFEFTQQYGGDDWEKGTFYDILREEEENIREVLIWCKKENDYGRVRDLWLLLNNYANIYCFWSDRLEWIEWLITESIRRNEWSTFVKMAIRKSWLLIRNCSPENLQEAEELLTSALNLQEDAELCDRADLAESMARLKIRQKNIADALIWLEKERDLVLRANLSENIYHRYLIPVQYHRAEICYNENDYYQANIFFQEVLESANKIGWHRVINSAQNWLADIAIHQGDREGSKKILIRGNEAAKVSKNQRRLARYQRSFARWEKKWGTLEKATEYATKAMTSFELLSMTKEKEEMQVFLNDLQTATGQKQAKENK